MHLQVRSPTQPARGWVKFSSSRIGQALFAWGPSSPNHYAELLTVSEYVQEMNRNDAQADELRLSEMGTLIPEFEYPFIVYDLSGAKLGKIMVAPISRPRSNDERVSKNMLSRFISRCGQISSITCLIEPSAILKAGTSNVPIREFALISLGTKYFGELRRAAGDRYVFTVTAGMPLTGRGDSKQEDYMEKEHDIESLEEGVPVELCMGELELTPKDILTLRPGMQIEFKAPEFEVVLKLGAGEWARGKLLVETGGCTLKLEKVLAFSVEDATFTEN